MYLIFCIKYRFIYIFKAKQNSQSFYTYVIPSKKTSVSVVYINIIFSNFTNTALYSKPLYSGESNKDLNLVIKPPHVKW